MPWVISLTLLIPLLLPSFCPFFPSLINVDWLLTLCPGAQSGSWNTASSCAICCRRWEAVYETVTKHPRNAEIKSQLWQSSVPEGRELSSLAFAEWEGSPLHNWGICARNWKPSKELSACTKYGRTLEGLCWVLHLLVWPILKPRTALIRFSSQPTLK